MKIKTTNRRRKTNKYKARSKKTYKKRGGFGNFFNSLTQQLTQSQSQTQSQTPPQSQLQAISQNPVLPSPKFILTNDVNVLKSKNLKDTTIQILKYKIYTEKQFISELTNQIKRIQNIGSEFLSMFFKRAIGGIVRGGGFVELALKSAIINNPSTVLSVASKIGPAQELAGIMGVGSIGNLQTITKIFNSIIYNLKDISNKNISELEKLVSRANSFSPDVNILKEAHTVALDFITNVKNKKNIITLNSNNSEMIIKLFETFKNEVLKQIEQEFKMKPQVGKITQEQIQKFIQLIPIIAEMMFTITKENAMIFMQTFTGMISDEKLNVLYNSISKSFMNNSSTLINAITYIYGKNILETVPAYGGIGLPNLTSTYINYLIAQPTQQSPPSLS